MEDKIYCVHLHDYATPSFYSGDKRYFGTKEDIIKVLKDYRLPKDRTMRKAGNLDDPHYNEEIILGYFDGKNNGYGTVFGEEERPIIYEVEVVGKLDTIHIDNFKYNHLNIWDHTYIMEANHVDLEIIYIRNTAPYNEKAEFIRIIRANFRDLTYNVDDIDFMGNPYKPHKVNSYTGWGHPGIMVDRSENEVASQVYMIDKLLESEEHLKKDMESPSDFDYSEIFNDVFGDG